MPLDDGDDEDLEIFEGGDDLAHFIADDLWPNAVKYFSKSAFSPTSTSLLTMRTAQAQEQEEEASDDDFESDEEEMAGVENGSPTPNNPNKRKAGGMS